MKHLSALYKGIIAGIAAVTVAVSTGFGIWYYNNATSESLKTSAGTNTELHVDDIAENYYFAAQTVSNQFYTVNFFPLPDAAKYANYNKTTTTTTTTKNYDNDYNENNDFYSSVYVYCNGNLYNFSYNSGYFTSTIGNKTYYFGRASYGSLTDVYTAKNKNPLAISYVTYGNSATAYPHFTPTTDGSSTVFTAMVNGIQYYYDPTGTRGNNVYSYTVTTTTAFTSPMDIMIMRRPMVLLPHITRKILKASGAITRPILPLHNSIRILV